nr:MAG TPA: hypothetical protein [Caudoviricetes sp.]
MFPCYNYIIHHKWKMSTKKSKIFQIWSHFNALK